MSPGGITESLPIATATMAAPYKSHPLRNPSPRNPFPYGSYSHGIFYTRNPILRNFPRSGRWGLENGRAWAPHPTPWRAPTVRRIMQGPTPEVWVRSPELPVRKCLGSKFLSCKFCRVPSYRGPSYRVPSDRVPSPQS